MKKTNLLVVSFSVLCAFNSFSQTLLGTEADHKVSGAQWIEYSEKISRPTFIEFNPSSSNFRLAVNNPLELMKEVLLLKPSDNLVSYKQEKDDLGFTHTRYKQYYKNIPVEGGEYIAHQKAGKLDCINGVFLSIKELAVTPSLTESQALEKALSFVGAKKYMWENKEEVANIREALEDPTINYDPKGTLVIYPKNFEVSDNGDFRLAYKFNIYAYEPESRADIFVDAKTGEIIGRHEGIHTADTPGKAHTKYSGEQTITVDKVSSTSYRLRETGRPSGGIATYNAQKASETNPTYPSTDFTDDDNDWNNFNANYDEVATDAHWATEMTWDYFKKIHGRDSYNGTGGKLVNYIHCGTNWFNANWNGQFMRYGDGSIGMPLTAIDIGAHEMSHGVTQNTANLTYQGESGALNESFSDIFGTCVEFMAKPTKADWLIGGDIGALRSMQHPKANGNPDTYKGKFWKSTSDMSSTGDNGGVHTNSGVQNHWFFILTVGATGVNDNNTPYSVKGIGMQKAEKIAFRTLANYLTSSSNYAAARVNSLKAATDLFPGNCTPEYIATALAWDAVGVTGNFTCNIAPIAGFNASRTSSCERAVQFKDQSSGIPVSWAWDFGDGTNSTDQNPLHTYTNDGTYTVKLTSTNANGSDVDTMSTKIVVKLIPPAVVNSKGRCGAGVVDLAASTTEVGNVLNWYDAQTGGTIVNTGDTYSPNLTTTTTYYVENTVKDDPKKVGALDSTSLSKGGMYNLGFMHGLYFDALAPLIIKSVKVYAGSAGNRTIEVLDVYGEPLLTKVVNVPKGESRIVLDFALPEGKDYFLTVTGNTGDKLDFQRATGGAKFPYTLPGLISITETDYKSVTPNLYYYFYDWEVQKSGCAGPRVAVVGTIDSEIAKPVITEAGKVLSAPVGNYTYQWSLDGSPISGATNQTYTPSKDGDYTVLVTGGACSNTSDPYPFIGSGINSPALDAAVKMYPNPVNGTLFIQAPLSGSNSITIGVYSIIGTLVYQETYVNNAQPHAVRLGSVESNGIYFIKLQSGNEVITRKFNLTR